MFNPVIAHHGAGLVGEGIKSSCIIQPPGKVVDVIGFNPIAPHSAFQQGPYPSYETAQALYHVEGALMWLNRRVEDRATRGVLGTETK